MTYKELQVLVRKALIQFLHNDKYLLEKAVREESISHRIAVYIENMIDGFNVDCEYDADIDEKETHKKIIPRRDGAVAEARPDIIVHRRGYNGSDSNQLVIEVKKSPPRPGELENDFDKLIGFTAPLPEGRFNYVCGALIQFGVKGASGTGGITWIKGGMEEGSEGFGPERCGG